MSELQKMYKESKPLAKGFSGADMISGLLVVIEPIILQFIQEKVKELLLGQKETEEKK